VTSRMSVTSRTVTTVTWRLLCGKCRTTAGATQTHHFADEASMRPPDFDEPFDPDFDPDELDKQLWAEVPGPIRKIVDQYVAAHLPAKSWRSCATCTRPVFLSATMMRSSISAAAWLSGTCRNRLSDKELAGHCFLGSWDECYIGVLAAIAATPI
jgi:hypothetical protein